MMKKECEDIGYELSAYMDGELSDKSRLAVEKHLKFCEDCNQLIQEFEETSNLVNSILSAKPETEIDLNRGWEEIKTQIDFKPSIWQKIKKPLRKPAIWIPTAVAAAATALVIFYMPFMHEKPQLEVSRVESVFSKSGQVMIMQTATSGQPLIWILPTVNKEAG